VPKHPFVPRVRFRSLLAILSVLGVLAGLVALAPAAGAGHPDRISGASRYETAAEISASRFSSGVPVAYVVTGVEFPDALAAGVAAGVRGGPVLLTAPTSLPAATAGELDRLQPAEIVVVGGAGSVSAGVESQLASYTSGPVTRVQGPDRYATAAAVAESGATFGPVDTVYVASGQTFADALAGVPAAVRAGAPLLLVTRTAVPAATAEALSRLGPDHAVVLGGPGTIDASVEDELAAMVSSTERLQGADRFATSAAVSARTFADGSPVAYLATGRTAADALAAGPVAGLAGGPVLLVKPNCIPYPVLDELRRLSPDRIVLLGGDRAVGPAVEDMTRCPSPHNVAGSPSVALADAPAWDDDGPDPHVVRFGHTYFAYTTGTTWGNRIGVLESDRPDTGWRTTTGQTWGSTALPSVPDWQVPDTQWAPAVYRFGGKYVLFYAAQVKATQEWCLSVATATDPRGPFQDLTGATGPIVCLDHLDGVIDPHPFVDGDGTPWLHFKNNDGFAGATDGVDAVSKIWAVRLSNDGTRPVGGYVEVMAKDTERYPWQTTLDNPQMVLRGGQYYLFHTGGDYVGNDTYATGYAVCAGPTGPCTTHPEPLLTSGGDVAGPGGGTVVRDLSGQWWMSYHAWTKGCYDYDACDGARKLYVSPLAF